MVKSVRDVIEGGASDESPQSRMDSWISAFTGLGSIQYDKRVGVYHQTEPLSFYECDDLYRGNDLAARIVDAPVDDGLREGFDLLIKEDEKTPDTQANPSGEDPAAKPPTAGGRSSPFGRRGDAAPYPAKGDAKDLQDRITTRWKDLKLFDAIGRAWRWGRAHGGAAVLLGADDGASDWSQPLNLERVKSLDWVTVLDAQSLFPTHVYADPRAAKYGDIALYRLNPVLSGQPVEQQATQTVAMSIHESRLIVFPGIRTSLSAQMQTSASNNGWGDSIFVRVNPVLKGYGVSWASAEVLLQDFAQAVLKIQGLAELLAQGRQDVLANRIRTLEQARSTIRAMVIDNEEEFERKQTPLTGLPEMMDKFAERLCAAAGMPRTRLFGTSPGGLNATGEHDLKNWYDSVAAEVRTEILPQLERVTEIMFKLEGGEPETWCIEPRPLWQPSDVETTTARKAQAETDQIYILQSVLSPEEVAMARFGGDKYSFETQVDFDARDALEPAASPPAKTEQQIEQEQAEAEQTQQAHEANVAVLQSKAKAPPPGRKDDAGCRVVEAGGKWHVYAADGAHSGSYPSQERADERVRQLEGK